MVPLSLYTSRVSSLPQSALSTRVQVYGKIQLPPTRLDIAAY